MARSFTYDQQKVTELRMEVIYAALEVMKGSKSVNRWSKYKKDMVLKMSPRVLPTLTEISGRDGKELPVPIFNVSAHNSNQEGIETE